MCVATSDRWRVRNACVWWPSSSLPHTPSSASMRPPPLRRATTTRTRTQQLLGRNFQQRRRTPEWRRPWILLRRGAQPPAGSRDLNLGCTEQQKVGQEYDCARIRADYASTEHVLGGRFVRRSAFRLLLLLTAHRCWIQSIEAVRFQSMGKSNSTNQAGYICGVALEKMKFACLIVV